jgi:mannitol-1-phosphate/altronate dehydrogenase
MRFDNKLDPKHEYSDEEIENMRNDPNFKDYKIFERYNNEYIKFLLNDVAQNNMGKNRLNYRSSINFAKDGGILKAQEGTGNGF